MQSRLITYLTCVLLALGPSVITAPPIFAGVSLNTIDPVAYRTESGRRVVVTGPIVSQQARG